MIAAIRTAVAVLTLLAIPSDARDQPTWTIEPNANNVTTTKPLTIPNECLLLSIGLSGQVEIDWPCAERMAGQYSPFNSSDNLIPAVAKALIAVRDGMVAKPQGWTMVVRLQTGVVKLGPYSTLQRCREAFKTATAHDRTIGFAAAICVPDEEAMR